MFIYMDEAGQKKYITVSLEPCYRMDRKDVGGVAFSGTATSAHSTPPRNVRVLVGSPVCAYAYLAFDVSVCPEKLDNFIISCLHAMFRLFDISSHVC